MTPDTLEGIERIVAMCEPCQRISNAPMRFLASVGYEDVKLNMKVFIDITHLDSRPELHIVDEATRFLAA